MYIWRLTKKGIQNIIKSNEYRDFYVFLHIHLIEFDQYPRGRVVKYTKINSTEVLVSICSMVFVLLLIVFKIFGMFCGMGASPEKVPHCVFYHAVFVPTVIVEIGYSLVLIGNLFLFSFNLPSFGVRVISLATAVVIGWSLFLSLVLFEYVPITG
jgi:hypothetical protein